LARSRRQRAPARARGRGCAARRPRANRVRVRSCRGAVRPRRRGPRDGGRARCRPRARRDRERSPGVHSHARRRRPRGRGVGVSVGGASRSRRGYGRDSATTDEDAGIVVVGGGVAGLAAAHHVTELAAANDTPVRVTLLEAAARLGGTIASERVDGFLVEAGADSLLTEKPWALDLCRRIGLEDRVIGTRDADRRTFIVHDGRLHALPDGFLLLAPTRFTPLLTTPLFSLRGKLRMALDLVLP